MEQYENKIWQARDSKFPSVKVIKIQSRVVIYELPDGQVKVRSKYGFLKNYIAPTI